MVAAIHKVTMVCVIMGDDRPKAVQKISPVNGNGIAIANTASSCISD
jgi:hypothetical protein